MTKRLSQWATPFALLVIAFFSYGIFAFQQGFHWDDWGVAWLIRTLGKPGLVDYFSTNRPFLAYVYSITTTLFGTNPIAWQLFSLIMRWLTAVSLLWVLRTIWPERVRETFFATVFFLVYPGFNQQAIGIIYGHFFLAQTLLFISIGLMLKFAHRPRQLWWAGLLGTLLSAFNLFSTEYFFGLELLRPVLLWLGLRQAWPDWKPRLKHAILTYLPFFLVLLGFLYWRYFILGFYLYQPELVTRPKHILHSKTCQSTTNNLGTMASRFLGCLGAGLPNARSCRIRSAPDDCLCRRVIAHRDRLV